MKRILSAVLIVCLALSLSVGAFAATVTPTAAPATVAAGQDVTVTLTLDEKIENVVTIAYELYFNADLFTLKESSNGNAYDGMTLSELNTKDGESYYKISMIDAASTGKTLKAGTLYTLTFTAKADVTAEQAAQFELRYLNGMNNSFASITHSAGDAASVTVQPAPTHKGYSAAIAGNVNVSVDEPATVTVSIANSEEGVTTYNAYHLTVSYDADKLTYTSVSPESKVTDSNGTLTISGYGADRLCGTDDITITFTGKAPGEAAVSLQSALVDRSANANADNTPAASLTATEATVTVDGYTVTLGEDFTGDSAVASGASYTFTAKDKNYDYDFTGSTMGGETVTVVDNDDGTFTVANVTGALNITATKEPKTFTVTVTGDGAVDVTAESTAKYLTDFSFTLTRDTAYTYNVVVTIGGTAYTPTLSETGSYSITGADITGDITIDVSKTIIPVTSTTITFTGSGSGDVEGGVTQTAENGKDFKFKIKFDEAYDYSIKLGEDELPCGEDGYFVIPSDKINGTVLTVTVERTAKSTITVEVAEYVKLDDASSVCLIMASGTVGEGKVLAYNGTPMFWSEKYNAYCYLVISGDDLETVKTTAEETIAEATAEKTNVAYDHDVNQTGVVDVNDAQLVYDIYMAKYSGFDTVTMDRFLEADVNGDRKVDTTDAAAIVNRIHTAVNTTPGEDAPENNTP